MVSSKRLISQYETSPSDTARGKLTSTGSGCGPGRELWTRLRGQLQRPWRGRNAQQGLAGPASSEVVVEGWMFVDWSANFGVK